MPARKIEDYAMIGDCETAALVARDGTIEWLCWPNFASDACFAALLGSAQNGHWVLAPAEEHIRITRRYQPHTLILETTFQTVSGTVVMTDFMPLRGAHSDLVRVVKCTADTVAMRMELCPRFHYGSTVPWVDAPAEPGRDPAWTAKAGADLIVLRTAVPVVESTPGILTAAFTLQAGQSHSFVLTYGCSFESIPKPIDPRKALEQTEDFWTGWAAKNSYSGPYHEAVERSLITLKALTYRPSGGIVAAPTTSLPERVGGPLN